MSAEWVLIAAKTALLLVLGYLVVSSAIGILVGSRAWAEAAKDEPFAPRYLVTSGTAARWVGSIVGVVMIGCYAGLAACLLGWLDPWISE